MMAYYRVRAGLPQKAEPYAGWDGGGRNLTGHIAGHHLSAVSLMYLATGDERFKQRARLSRARDEGSAGQARRRLSQRAREWARGVRAVSKGEIRSGAFDLNGLWSPWYTLHKTFAGLRDAYRHTGNSTALDVETKYAAWAEGVLAPLTDEQVQKMLNTEHGGMNEVLADLYADTGDKRWLELSYRFEHHAFTDALKRHQDNLAGKHGNCQIPKLIGSAARYGYTGDTGDISRRRVLLGSRRRSITATRPAATDSPSTSAPRISSSARVDGRTCESCNGTTCSSSTRRLFSFRPDAFYADFHERALFNHVLASIDPENGRTSYMVPVGRGVQQEYQNMLRELHLLRRHGDGEPRAARRRRVLRVRRHAVGEPVRSVDGEVHARRRLSSRWRRRSPTATRRRSRSRSPKPRSSRSPCAVRHGRATDSP